MSAQFTVWIRDKGDEESWVEQLSTDDIEEAARVAIELGVDDTIATIWERGHFKVDGHRRTDNIMFWWSANDNERMESEPQGRGAGWPEHHDECVSYEPAGGTAVARAGSAREVAAAPSPRYATVECATCNRYVTKHDAMSYEQDVEVGHSSGSIRRGSSLTHRDSSRSSSTSSRSSWSRSSGRTYYKHQTVWICIDCCNERVAAEEAEAERRRAAFPQNVRSAIITSIILVALIAFAKLVSGP